MAPWNVTSTLKMLTAELETVILTWGCWLPKDDRSCNSKCWTTWVIMITSWYAWLVMDRVWANFHWLCAGFSTLGTGTWSDFFNYFFVKIACFSIMSRGSDAWIECKCIHSCSNGQWLFNEWVMIVYLYIDVVNVESLSLCLLGRKESNKNIQFFFPDRSFNYWYSYIFSSMIFLPSDFVVSLHWPSMTVLWM